MTLSDFKSMMASGMLKRRKDLMVTPLDTQEYYESQEKKIICFSPSTPKHIQVFDNEEIFLRMVTRANQHDYEKHILEPYVAQLANMPLAIDNAHKSLQVLLGLTDEQLNYTFESFRLIDVVLKQRRFRLQDFLHDFYFLLMLYAGETVCRQRGGHWQVKDTPYAKEPYVILPNGSTMNVFMALYNEAVESFDTLSVFDTIDLLLFEDKISF